MKEYYSLNFSFFKKVYGLWSIVYCLLLFNSVQAKDLFDFGLSLYNENDYYRAISEFQRFIFYYPENKRINDAYCYIAKSYYFAAQYNQAISCIKNYLNIIKEQAYRNRLYFYLANSYLRNENYNQSIKTYNLLIENARGTEIAEYSFYRLGWVYIFQTDWQKALNKFNEFENRFPDSKIVYKTKLIKEDLKSGVNFTPLSPTLAAVLSSVIPGSGQVYCKRIGDGIVALALVSAFTYASYYYYNNGPKEMFYGIGLLNILFYMGNIYTAYGSAHKYNRNFNLQLKERLFNSYYEDYEL